MPTFYGAIDLVRNELRNAVVQNLGTAPATPAKGQLWMDSTANILKWYDGATWVNAMSAGALTPSDTVTSPAIGAAAAGGSLSTYSRGDHSHGMPSFGAVSAETAFGGTSGNGTAVTLARSDHTHGTPTHDQAAHSGFLGNVTALTAFGVASGNGSAGTFSRSDHVHGSPAHDTAAHSGILGAVTAQTAFGAASNNGMAGTVSRSDHVHGTPTHDAAAHSAIPLSALAVPTAALALNNQRITGLATPTADADGATKLYVDNVAQGLDAKASCRAATTANITLSAPQTIDGIAVVAGDRVLVKNQTTASANGIYVVAAAAWTRATDMNAWAQVPNAFTFVEQGTTQADTGWVSTADQGGTIGTTAIPWVQFSGAGTYQAGNGLVLTGNSFAVGQGTGVIVNAANVAVDTATIATVASLSGYVPTSRTVTAGNGLTGGGDLTANRSLAVGAGTGILSTAGQVAVDTTVIATVASVAGMVRKFAAALTGTTGSEVVTHNLNTRDVSVTVYNGATPFTAVEVDWDATTVNTVTIRYNPNLGAGFRVVVMG
jgi:hypothetical protein